MIIHYHIKEQSFIARIAAFNLRKDHAAIVIHRTIHLWGISKADFQAQLRYVNHEFQHLYQYQQLVKGITKTSLKLKPVMQKPPPHWQISY